VSRTVDARKEKGPGRSSPSGIIPCPREKGSSPTSSDDLKHVLPFLPRHALERKRTGPEKIASIKKRKDESRRTKRRRSQRGRGKRLPPSCYSVPPEAWKRIETQKRQRPSGSELGVGSPIEADEAKDHESFSFISGKRFYSKASGCGWRRAKGQPLSNHECRSPWGSRSFPSSPLYFGIDRMPRQKTQDREVECAI